MLSEVLLAAVVFAGFSAQKKNSYQLPNWWPNFCQSLPQLLEFDLIAAGRKPNTACGCVLYSRTCSTLREGVSEVSGNYG